MNILLLLTWLVVCIVIFFLLYLVKKEKQIIFSYFPLFATEKSYFMIEVSGSAEDLAKHDNEYIDELGEMFSEDIKTFISEYKNGDQKIEVKKRPKSN